jgi:hypothetical protein
MCIKAAFTLVEKIVVVNACADDDEKRSEARQYSRDRDMQSHKTVDPNKNAEEGEGVGTTSSILLLFPLMRNSCAYPRIFFLLFSSRTVVSFSHYC